MFDSEGNLVPVYTLSYGLRSYDEAGKWSRSHDERLLHDDK